MPPPPRRRCRRNTYFVDTKTTCFLCLQDIPPPPPPPPPIIILDDDEEENGEKVVEGEGQSSVVGKEEGVHVGISQERKKFCLRTICKYLRMDPWKVLSSKMAGGSLLDMIGVKLQNTDLLVKLCDDCTNVATTLSEMCEELEVLQMKVDHSLRNFAEVLKNSIHKTSLLEEFKSKLTSPLEHLQASVAESMRQETKKKCLNRLDKSLPKVLLVAETVKNVSNRTGATVPNLIPITSSSSITPDVPLLNMKTEKAMIKPGQFKCNLCGFAFGSRSGLIQHRYRRHPPASTSSTPSISTPHNCNSCGARLPSKADWIRHSRLYCPYRKNNQNVTAPAQPLMEVPKVSDFDRSKITIPTVEVLNGMMNPMPHIKTVSNQFLCSLCPTKSVPYNSEDTLRRHLLAVHPDYFFRPVKLEGFTQKDFKAICEEVIEKEAYASYKTFNIERPDGATDGGPSYVCVHCSNVHYEKRGMNVHLIQSHYELLASKLVDLQWSKNKTKANPPSSTPRDRDWRPNIKLKSGRWKCPDCGRVFCQNSSLCRHRKKRSCLSSGRAVNDVITRYEIAEIPLPAPAPMSVMKMANILKKRKRSAPVGSLGRFKCLDCGAGFAHSTSLWRHRKMSNHMIGFGPNSRPQPQPVPQVSLPPQNPITFSCEFCGNEFGKQRYLKNHQRRTACALKTQQRALGNSQTENDQLLISTSFSMAHPPQITPPPPPPVILTPVTFLQYSPVEMTITPPPPPVTEAPVASKSWACEYCRKLMSSSSVLNRHKRENCPKLKAMQMQDQGDSSSMQFMEQNYFEEQGGEEMMEEGEVYQDTYVNTKVEVLEMSQVQLSNSMVEDAMVVKSEEGCIFMDGQETSEGNYAHMEDNQQNEEMMILPDTEDPLQF